MIDVAPITPRERSNAILEDSRRRSVAYAKRPSYLRGVDREGHWSGKPLSAGKVRVSGGLADDTMGITDAQRKSMLAHETQREINGRSISPRPVRAARNQHADPFATVPARAGHTNRRNARRAARIATEREAAN